MTAAKNAVWSATGGKDGGAACIRLDDSTLLNIGPHPFTAVAVFTLRSYAYWFDLTNPVFNLGVYNNSGWSVWFWPWNTDTASMWYYGFLNFSVNDGISSWFYNRPHTEALHGGTYGTQWDVGYTTVPMSGGSICVVWGADSTGTKYIGACTSPTTHTNNNTSGTRSLYGSIAPYGLPSAYAGPVSIMQCNEMILHEFYLSDTPLDGTIVHGPPSYFHFDSDIPHYYYDYIMPCYLNNGTGPFVTEDVNCKTHLTFGPAGQIIDSKGLPWYMWNNGTIASPTTTLRAVDWASAASGGSNIPGSKHNTGKD